MISLIKRKGANPLTKEVIYYPKWTRVATTDATKLAKIMARGGTFSVGEATGLLTDFPQYVCDELLNGNAVEISGLGTFKLKISGKSQKDIKDVSSKDAVASVVFEPNAELSSRIANESEFRFVTTVTKEGEQDVEDNTSASSSANTSASSTGSDSGSTSASSSASSSGSSTSSTGTGGEFGG